MLDSLTQIEVIAIKDGISHKKEMTMYEYKNIKRVVGYSYVAYQIGKSCFKN